MTCRSASLEGRVFVVGARNPERAGGITKALSSLPPRAKPTIESKAGDAVARDRVRTRTIVRVAPGWGADSNAVLASNVRKGAKTFAATTINAKAVRDQTWIVGDWRIFDSLGTTNITLI